MEPTNQDPVANTLKQANDVVRSLRSGHAIFRFPSDPFGDAKSKVTQDGLIYNCTAEAIHLGSPFCEYFFLELFNNLNYLPNTDVPASSQSPVLTTPSDSS